MLFLVRITRDVEELIGFISRSFLVGFKRKIVGKLEMVLVLGSGVIGGFHVLFLSSWIFLIIFIKACMQVWVILFIRVLVASL